MLSLCYQRERGRWVPDCDPVKFILSKNVHRRHLTPEQRREAIARFLKADPMARDHKVAKTLHVDDKTVAAVRREAVQSSGIPNVAHQPGEKARAALKENPELSVRELAKVAGVSTGTAATARRAPVKPAKPPKPAPPDLRLRPITAEEVIRFARHFDGSSVSKEQACRYLRVARIICRRAGFTDKEIVAIIEWSDPQRSAGRLPPAQPHN